MTKRDVCIWFCRVWALQGILGAAILGLSQMVATIFVPQNRGALLGLINSAFSLPTLAVSIFLWLFAVGVGTELAAEGEHGEGIVSKKELAPLLLRCVGLALLLSGAVLLSRVLVQWGYYRYFDSSMGRVVFPAYTASAVNGVAQSILGFLLAFTPRIRQFLRK